MAYKDHHLPNNHNRIRDLLSPYLDGEVTEEEKAVVEAELAVSVEMRRELETLRRTINLVSSLPPVTAPRPFTLSEADVKPPQPASRSGWYLGLPGWLGGLATLAAVLVCVAAVGFFLMTRQFGTGSRPEAAGEIAKVPTPAAPQAAEREAQQEAAPAAMAAPQAEGATAESQADAAEDTALLAEEAPQPAEAPAAKAGPEEDVETFSMAQENAEETGSGQVPPVERAPAPPPAPTLAAPTAPGLPQVIEEEVPAEAPMAPQQEDQPVTGLAAEESDAVAETPVEAAPAEEPAAKAVEEAPAAPLVEKAQPPEVGEEAAPVPPQADQSVTTMTAEAAPPPAAPGAPQESAPVEESAAQAVPPPMATVEAPTTTKVEDGADTRLMEEAAPAPPSPPATEMHDESLRTEIPEAPKEEVPGEEGQALAAPSEQAAAVATAPETDEVAPEQEMVEEAAPPVEPLPGPQAPDMAGETELTIPPAAGPEQFGAPQDTQPREQPPLVEQEVPEVMATPVPVPATVIPITVTPASPGVTATAVPSPTAVAQLTATPTPQEAATAATPAIQQEMTEAAAESSTWLFYLGAVVVVVLAIIGLVIIRVITRRR